jgi:6-phosphogluconolactonase/glucosamine-6-phosphate isomerase/deaminase
MALGLTLSSPELKILGITHGGHVASNPPYNPLQRQSFDDLVDNVKVGSAKSYPLSSITLTVARR